MQADKLIKQIRAHRGELLVPVHYAHGVMHVAVVKSDLVEQLRRFGNGECGYQMLQMNNGDWTIDAE